MIRTQISLPEDQYRLLKERAAATGKSMSALIREALSQSDVEREARWDRAFSWFGRTGSGLGDLAERHDDYLVEDIARRKSHSKKRSRG
jgi:hypothetical protein